MEFGKCSCVKYCQLNITKSNHYCFEKRQSVSSVYVFSPVVLAGPPRLTFKKPVVLSFGHCALAQNTWEMGVYHCDSLFSDSDDTPWVKLTTVGQFQDSQVLAHTENDSCHVMTDYLSRFCLVGQSSNQLGAVKALYLLIFGKPMSTSSLDFCVSVQVTDRTPSALEMALRQAERQGLSAYFPQ